MNLKLGLAAIAAMFWAGNVQAQSCENSWGFVADGGFEADAPEAFSPCQPTGSVGVLCVGPALMVTYSPTQGALLADPDGGEHWPINLTIDDFQYADYAYYMGATGQFAFVRVAWDNFHPLFGALQSGREIVVSVPNFGLESVVQLTGSREAISQVIEACQQN